ncbi:GNAT family N-acetyltransferase [Metabacillus sp. GX 13764]|uniref:GNAT family N-acetyltransferase n=1 Tax=Metabacillus kandeliae TaxID=2900151 RepID=UPI001E28C812|nr:GNAT family N-acetyltransferase [Metabacillus kandeliae]MCD7034773.1 GNAT family N-acetyltransferase [Metabacillus kandeliae]
MQLRKAAREDEMFLRLWLDNERDCEFAVNKKVYTSDDFFSWLDAEDQHGYFLLNEQQEPLAYGEIWVDEAEKDLEFAHLVVAPNKRSQGVGKILISRLEKEADKFDFPVIYMRVNPDNAQAISCYVKGGFEIQEQFESMPDSKWTWLKKDLI